MALYTLKSRDEALLPLANYNGDNTWVRNQMYSLGYTPTPAQTQVYSALGRTTGAEGNGGSNFFEKRGRSIENAFGTTGSSIVSAVNDRIENDKTTQMLKDNKTRMNDIAKKYGFNSWSDWQDANAAARESGDTEAIKRFDTQLKEFQAQANANAARANEKAANYEDYRKNDYISNKINQDQGKFAGSAINTLSTAVDVTGLGATPVSNAIQGGIEGVADELEQNGFENFDWGRAGQNAAIGATTGAVTGALNAGISNSLAKRAAAKGLTNTATKAGFGNALKSGAKTIATGAARGALSGAVGGATGAGLQSAMNGVEFGQGVQNALQGAVQGAQQGAVTGGIMAGANAAFGKTNFGKQLQNAKTNWDQSGSNFDERLTNTLTSGDSAVGDWLMNKRQSNVLGAAGSLGNRVQDVSDLQTMLTDIRQRAEKLDANRDDYGMPDESWRSDAYGYEELLNNPQTRKVIDSLELTHNPTAAQAAAITQYLRDNGYLDTPTTAKGWAKKAGQRIVEDINNKGVGLTVKDTSLDQYKNDSKSRVKLISEIAERAETLKSQPRGKYGTNSWDNDLFEYPDIDEKVLNTLGISGDLDGPRAAAVTQVLKEKGIIPSTNTPTTASLARGAGYNNEAEAWEAYAKYKNNLAAEEYQNRLDSYNAAVEAKNGDFSYNDKTGRIIDVDNGYKPPKYSADELNEWLLSNQQAQTPTTAKGWAKKAGQRIVEDINNSNLGLRVKDVSSDMPEDIRNMQIRDYNANADGGIDTTYGIASDPRVRQQLLANVNAQLAENPNARIGDTNFDADAIISEYSDRLTPEQYRNFNPADAENALVQELQGLEASQGFTRPNSRQITQTTQVDPWDRVAQEAGYSNYDEVLQRYAEANPNAKINPRGMAGQVLTWMDQNPNTPTTAAGWAKRAGQRAVEDVNNSNLGLRVQDVSQDDPSKRLYNALVGNQEPVATAKANTLPEADMGIEEATAKTSKAGKLRNAAGLKYAAQYGTIDKPTAKATNPAKTFTELAELGFTKPADVERMAGAMTGSNGEMSALVRNVVNASDPVDTFAGEKSGQTLDDYINLSIQKHGLDGIREGKAVKSQIDALMGSLPSHAEGSIDFQDTPEAVFKLTQQLDAEAANYRGKSGMNYGTTTPDKLRAAQVISDVSGLLKDRIYSNSDVKQALTPEVAQNLKSYAPNNKAWAKYVDDTVMNMENVKDLRSAQANWVNANKIIDNAYVNSMTYGGRVGGSGSIPLTKRGLAGAILDKTINSDTGLRTQAKLLNKAADFVDKNPDTNATANPDTAAGWAKQAGKRAAEDLGNTNLGNRIQDVSGQPVNPQVATPAELANTVADYNPSTQLYNAIGRTEGAIAQETPAQYLANAAQEAEIVSPMEAPTAPTNDIATSMGNASTATYNALTGTPTTAQQATTGSINTGYYQPTGDYWTDIIASAMSAAIDANDVNAFTTLYGMYQDQMANVSKANSKEKDYTNPTNWSSADRTKLLSAQNAMGQIDQLEEAYNQATGGEGSNAIQGWLRSRASDISGGNWDPSASNYNSLSESVGMGIVKNLINLGVTEADAQRYLKYLPALTDTKEQAAQKLDTLRGIYQNQINNLYGAYGL